MPEQRAIVTGAAGFIGSHTAAALLSRGCAVLGLNVLFHFMYAYGRRLRPDPGEEQLTILDA